MKKIKEKTLEKSKAVDQYPTLRKLLEEEISRNYINSQKKNQTCQNAKNTISYVHTDQSTNGSLR